MSDVFRLGSGCAVRPGESNAGSSADPGWLGLAHGSDRRGETQRRSVIVARALMSLWRVPQGRLLQRNINHFADFG
jgi:hypothetical protein